MGRHAFGCYQIPDYLFSSRFYIPELVGFFMQKYDPRRRFNSFAPEALKLMGGYHWPGNTGELANTLEVENAGERGVILCTGKLIDSGFLSHEMTGDTAPGQVDRFNPPEEGTNLPENIIKLPAEGLSLEQVERDLITQALSRSGGNQTKAACLLGITRSALIYRMEKNGLVLHPG